MNKKGFTLVELLIVIGLIALLMIIFMPSLLANSQNIKYKTYDNKINLIQTGGINFVESNTNAIKGNSGVCVSLEYLISNGYLVSDGKDDSYILNPITGERLTGDVLLEYDIDENDNWIARATYLDNAQCSVVIQLPPDEYSSKYGISNNEPPTGNSVVINDGAATTISTDVKLTIGNTSGTAKEMCISNTTTCSDILWVPYASTVSHWILDSTNGSTTKTVYVKLRDESGLTSVAVTDTIEYVDPYPTITFTPNSNTTYKKAQTGTTKIESFVNITSIKYAWGTTKSTDLSTSGTTISFTQAKSVDVGFTTSTRSGILYLCIYAKNASNYGVTKCSEEFYADNVLPAVSVNYSGTTAKSHNPILTVTDNTSSIQTIKYKWATTQTSASTDGTIITSGSTIPSYGNVTGTYYLCVYAIDVAGNYTNSYFQYIYDNTPPVISSFRINNNAAETYSRNVTLNSSVTGAAQMCFSNNNLTSCDGTWNTYSTSYSNWQLSGTSYGTYIVYAWYKDAAGNITASVQDSINYAYAIIPSGYIEINGGVDTTTSTSVSLYISASNAVKMCVTNSSSCTPGTNISTSYYTTIPRTISGYQNQYNTITVVLQSSTGNQVVLQDSIYYSVPIINAPSIYTNIPDGGPYPAGQYVTTICDSPDAAITNFVVHDDSSQFGVHADDYGVTSYINAYYRENRIQMASASSAKCFEYCYYTITASCSNSGGTTYATFYFTLELTWW